MPDTPYPRGADTPAHTHRNVSGGWLRPTVFGAMDGLVTNVSLIMGVGGGGVRPHILLLTGLAGLVAGAFSMATGEYISVTSQNELVAAEVDVERRAHAGAPEEEREELARLYTSRGVPGALARQFVDALSADSEEHLQAHAREELGIDPDELPSPWTAAASSSASFAIGAAFPLAPYLLGAPSLVAVVAVSAVVAIAGGAALARLTSRSVIKGAFRQLALGALAAAATYGVGAAIGTSAAG
jgi:VIT1/CCC1 family predicted Fe2+/Mn2+ transporter